MSIDTLELATDLEAAGMSAEQAKGTARALNKAVKANVATKADLLVMEERLYSRMVSYMAVQAAGIIALNLAGTAAVVGVLLKFAR